MQTSAEKIWAAAQQQLRSMLSVDTYNLWFAPLRACALENNSIVLEVANDFCEVWLKDNYLGLLQDAMAADPLDPAGVYFGTTMGEVYYSADTGENWHRLPGQFPRITTIKTWLV